MKKHAVAQNRTEVSSATTKCTNHYTTTASVEIVRNVICDVRSKMIIVVLKLIELKVYTNVDLSTFPRSWIDPLVWNWQSYEWRNNEHSHYFYLYILSIYILFLFLLWSSTDINSSSFSFYFIFFLLFLLTTSIPKIL